MASVPPSLLQPSYTKLLRLLTEWPDSGDEIWISDAGFRKPRGDMHEWSRELLAQRWPGMHPDLIPFASDGAGNRYCFHHGAFESSPAILLWMYETYRAVPIAGDFDEFVDYLVLTAGVGAREGVDPVLDQDHYENVVQNLAAELGRPSVSADVIRAAMNGGIATAFVSIAPLAPAARLVCAEREAKGGDLHHALRLCQRALEGFREFTAAEYTIGRLTGGQRAASAHFDALVRALGKPLAYAGDSLVPHFGSVDPVDPAWLGTALVQHGALNERSLADPVWSLVVEDELVEPDAWLRLAVIYANESDMAAAITAASNALYLDTSGDFGAGALALLLEIYEAIDSPWHQAVIRRNAGEPEFRP